MTSVVIRAATARDVPALLRLYRAAGIDGERGFTEEEALAHFAVLERYPYFRVFVAVAGEVIAGTYGLVILDKLTKRGQRSGVVEDVAVHPDQHGQGIGRAMMQHALEQCRAAGCCKMALSSNLKRVDAHRFYDSLGFERHGYSFRTDLP